MATVALRSQVPIEYIDPSTKKIMSHPTKIDCNHCFEGYEIRKIAVLTGKCPTCEEEISQLTEDAVLASRITTWLRDNSVPSEFIDPNSQEIFTEPELLGCGHTFERAWVNEALNARPVRNCATCHTGIVENSLNSQLKERIEQYMEAHPLPEGADYGAKEVVSRYDQNEGEMMGAARPLWEKIAQDTGINCAITFGVMHDPVIVNCADRQEHVFERLAVQAATVQRASCPQCRGAIEEFAPHQPTRERVQRWKNFSGLVVPAVNSEEYPSAASSSLREVAELAPKEYRAALGMNTFDAIFREEDSVLRTIVKVSVFVLCAFALLASVVFFDMVWLKLLIGVGAGTGAPSYPAIHLRLRQ